MSVISKDKDAEITANAVISMLHLSVDEKTTEQMLELQVLSKICSLVGAASANIAVQRRAMYMLSVVGNLCVRMDDDSYSKVCFVLFLFFFFFWTLDLTMILLFFFSSFFRLFRLFVFFVLFFVFCFL